MANPTQLLLLADHIKLSLLERQRALSLNLEPNSQDGHISQSLSSFRDGLEAVERERRRLEERGDPSAIALQEQETRLRKQFDDLSLQFQGFPAASHAATAAPISSSSSPPSPPPHSQLQQRPPQPAPPPNDRPRVPSSSSFLKRPPHPNNGSSGIHSSKSVRFTDAPLSPSSSPSFPLGSNHHPPYRDDPTLTPTAPTPDDNPVLLSQHAQILHDQDEQLDRLGASIGRQRELSIQIGDELDSHVAMLDELDGHVARQQTRLERARRRLGAVARRAVGENVQLSVIVGLIFVLVVLIAVLK